jgi:hypothetical protein
MAASNVLQMIHDVKDETLRNQLKKEAFEDLARTINHLPLKYGGLMVIGAGLIQWYNDKYTITFSWQDILSEPVVL